MNPSTRRRGRLTSAASWSLGLFLAAWGAGCGSASVVQTAAYGSAARSDRVAEALAELEADAGCADVLTEELAVGVEGTRCGQVRRRLRAQLDHMQPGAKFGWVEQRKIDLRRLRLILGEARRCRTWPLRDPEETVLWGKQVRAAGCGRRRYEGTLPVYGITEDGRRVPVFEADVENGAFELQYARLDRRLRLGGHDGLDAFDRLELGTGAWAGTVDLVRLRQFLSEWHFRWVQLGRGAPGLFVARHPDHANADDGRALAVEARLARQEHDYLAVARGELSPLAFLDRHLWSPYRSSVRSIHGERNKHD